MPIEAPGMPTQIFRNFSSKNVIQLLDRDPCRTYQEFKFAKKQQLGGVINWSPFFEKKGPQIPFS